MSTSNNFQDSDRIDETSLTLLDRTQAYLEALLRAQAPNTLLVEAWTEFYRLYSRLIRRYVLHRKLPECEVDDCIQEIWMAIAQKLTRFQHPRNRPGLRAWLYAVVRSKTADVMRRRSREALPSLGVEATEDVAAASESQNVWERLLMQTIMSEVMSDESEMNRQILRRRLLEGRRSAEVAAELGVSPKVVRYRLKRVLNRLQVRWAFYTGQPLGTSSLASPTPENPESPNGAVANSAGCQEPGKHREEVSAEQPDREDVTEAGLSDDDDETAGGTA